VVDGKVLISRSLCRKLFFGLLLICNPLLIADGHSAVATPTRIAKFALPDGIALVGSNGWVADNGSASDNGDVTEFSTTSGAIEQIIKAPSDQIDAPSAISASGSNIWIAVVADAGALAGNLIELKGSNGSLEHVINSPADEISSPLALAVSGSHLWVANGGGGYVTELNSSNGSLVRAIDIQRDNPGALMELLPMDRLFGS
jgi:hypothetical protein